MPIRQILPPIAGLVAGLLAFAITGPGGPALAPDSMSYLGAAQSLAQHRTLRVPLSDWNDADSTAALTDYAPGFPIVLAAPIALGAPPVPAARYVQALAAGLTTAIATA
ncbi:MAG: hypothetical protein ACHQXA_10595, partial [Gemmatimonadales bacterium]